MLEHIAGNFLVNSGKIRATDPCYKPDIWCAGSFPARNGMWVATYEKLPHEKTGWGERISRLRIHHLDYAQENLLFQEKWTPDTKLDIVVGVDSGQAGFFDHEVYMQYGGDKRSAETDYKWDDNSFYGRACKCTLSQERIPDDEREKDENGFFITPMFREYGTAEVLNIPEFPYAIGAISRSGFGDGSYDLYVKNDENGVAVVAEIVFIDEGELEEEFDNNF